jgi:hypothetical protein
MQGISGQNFSKTRVKSAPRVQRVESTKEKNLMCFPSFSRWDKSGKILFQFGISGTISVNNLKILTQVKTENYRPLEIVPCDPLRAGACEALPLNS